jgi:hypothetical protein
LLLRVATERRRRSASLRRDRTDVGAPNAVGQRWAIVTDRDVGDHEHRVLRVPREAE